MYFKLLMGILLAVTLHHFYKLLMAFGYFHKVHNHAPGPCRMMTEIEGGSEDIEITPDGVAFITSGYRPDVSKEGRLFIYEFTKPDARARQLKFKNFDDTDFWPHGLALWTDPKTKAVTLFVINHHAKKGERVEKFLYQSKPEMLVHLETITDPSMTIMNDIVALDNRRFYFTNYFNSHEKYANMLETYLMLPWGSLVYYDGTKGHVIHTGFVNNGLALSPDKKYLYEALFTEGIKVFKRSEVNGQEKLEFVELMEHTNGIDNIHVDMETGDVWTAAPNSVLEFQSTTADRSSLCGSRVFRFKANNGHLSEGREVYANDGSETSCSATGNRYKEHLLIGSIFSHPTHCIIKAY